MTRSIFIFIAAVFLMAPFVFHNHNLWGLENQLSVCGPVLLLLGIPHGAVDNVLYRRSRSVSDVRFIIIYLLAVGSIVFIWFITPFVAYILFLATSAYHFGQSQFSHYAIGQRLRIKLLFCSWGLLLIFGLLFFNSHELTQLSLDYPEFQSIHITDTDLLLMGLLFSGASTLTLIILMYIKGEMMRSHVFMELLVLVLLLVIFYLFPFLIGFTLYFLILHAFKVMNEEFRFLKLEGDIHSLAGFIRLLSTFSIISFAGIILLYLLILTNCISTPFGYALLVLISAITIPHTFVMDQFYVLLFKLKFYNNQDIIH